MYRMRFSLHQIHQQQMKMKNHENKEDITTTIIRQLSRNWADCPIDDSVVDTSPPPSANNTLITNDIDDFQV